MGYIPPKAPPIVLSSGKPYDGPGFYLESRIKDWEQGRNIPKVSDLFEDDGRNPYWPKGGRGIGYQTSLEAIKEMSLADVMAMTQALEAGKDSFIHSDRIEINHIAGNGAFQISPARPRFRIGGNLFRRFLEARTNSTGPR